jgi:3-hydroxyisobutyrate dehydrogenase-like beta-hydroxyacid dehydrogenase
VRVGLLFPGQMGAAVGAAARAEVVWASDGRGPATAERARRAALLDVGSLAELVSSSEIVLSVCPPAIAEDVAAHVFDLGFAGVYVDANAIAPARLKRIAALGSRVVDGSIIGGSDAPRLYLSGGPDDVQRVATLFAGTAVEAIPLGTDLGAASALKMAYGGWNKIGVALTAQAHSIARAYGVTDALESEGVAAERVVRFAPRAWRWAPEMREVSATCAELGLPAEIGRGAAELYARWDEHRDTEVALDQLLDDLVAIAPARRAR